MKAKLEEKSRALELRMQGLSYSEIRKTVPVSKSSLSLWLSGVYLRKPQKNRLKEKLIAVGKLGAEAKRKQRIDKEERIRNLAIFEIKNIENKELFYMGVMLYWAEGAKQRNATISQGVDFANSDPNMCKLFLKWLQVCLKIQPDRIRLRIYIHESKKRKSNEALAYWVKTTLFPAESFNRTCFTKTVYPRKNRRKDKGKYYGLLRINVRKSTDLNRKIAGWIEGVCLQSGVAGQNKL